MQRFPLSDSCASDRNEAARGLLRAARAGGAAIAPFLGALPVARSKADASPVTAADLASHDAILAVLAEDFPGLPIVSEEAAGHAAPSAMPALYLLVDPLDGTREFLAGSGEFTVNVALIDQGRPSAGVVLAPVTGHAWCAGDMAWSEAADGTIRRLAKPAADASHPLRALVSRFHLDAMTGRVLDRLGIGARAEAGAALKYARIAAGEADLHLRFGPTMAWDTAAGQALLAAVGGVIVDHRGQSLDYGPDRPDWRNSGLIALRDPERLPDILAAIAQVAP
jgi:3'(2'), 5'-bisphosphate nucleotidase